MKQAALSVEIPLLLSIHVSVAAFPLSAQDTSPFPLAAIITTAHHELVAISPTTFRQKTDTVRRMVELVTTSEV